MKLFFDTETTGLAKFNLDPQHPSQPHIVSVSALLVDEGLNVIQTYSDIINPSNRYNKEQVEPQALAAHGITFDKAITEGISIDIVRAKFISMLTLADTIVGHNLKFDKILAEREGFFNSTRDRVFKEYCTMLAMTPIAKLPKKRGGGYKWPKCQEAYKFCFGHEFEGAHNSLNDIRATLEIYKWIHNTTYINKLVNTLKEPFKEPAPIYPLQPTS